MSGSGTLILPDRFQANGLPEKIFLEDAHAVEWTQPDDVAAADGEQKKMPRFAMLAYTGGAMRVGGYYRPVAVDLSGVKVIGKTIPIFRQHDPGQIVGHGEAQISATDIRAEGLISADNEHSRDVVNLGRNGFPWQASIGASVEEFESIKEGQKIVVNGKTVAGPVLVARKSLLSEISFVPLGADRRTSAKVSAGEQQKPASEFEEWLVAYGFDLATITPRQRIVLRLARYAATE